MQKLLYWLFAILIFFTPIILWPYTSEVFEFNKMVFVYLLTISIVVAWGARSITERKIIFRRTLLDIPLLIFLGSQLISTILSIDPSTSWLGYYSRFNGGLLSTICYSLLYWAAVSNLDLHNTSALLKVWLGSAVLVSAYGVMEHFGIDKNLWVQDVQSRIFSTLGQPNWLAAWIVALIPVAWQGALKKEGFWVYFGLSVLLFWTLIFTKSRSGYLALATTFVVFWAFNFKKHWKELLKVGISFAIICLISGTEYTPSLYSHLHPVKAEEPVVTQSGTVLETGGTESGKIRQIVWKGAFEVWRHYPIFGTGVETFAYSYYQFRPAEHNLVSEWDFIYNKAHNEYLNFAANSGTVGLASYLAVVATSLVIMFRFKNYALLAGSIGLLVSNFFGFSVVPDQLELFLFPAFAIALTIKENLKPKTESLSQTQKFSITALLVTGLYLAIVTCRYWYADFQYNYGRNNNAVGRANAAISYLKKAISISPSQPKYHQELASAYATLAQAANDQKDASAAAQVGYLAISEEQKAVNLSPQNVLVKIAEFGTYIKLSTINPDYLAGAKQVLLDATKLAPTYAKLYYNLGLIYARTGENDQAMETLRKTIDLKANYKDARLAYAYLLIDKGESAMARTQLEYILGNIDPNDPQTHQTLENLK